MRCYFHWSAAAPGIFGLAGVFTDPQFQVVVRALNQKKGVDLLSAPKVTTKSGQRAIIEVVREFRYPTLYSSAGSIDQQQHWKYRCWRCDNCSRCCDSNDTSRLGDAKHRVTLEVEP